MNIYKEERRVEAHHGDGDQRAATDEESGSNQHGRGSQDKTKHKVRIQVQGSSPGHVGDLHNRCNESDPKRESLLKMMISVIV